MSDYWAAAPVIWFGMQKWVWQDTTDQHHEWLLSCCSNHIIWYAKVSMAGYYRPTPWVTIELLLQSYYLVCKSEYGRILQTNTMSDYWAAAPIIWFGMQKWVWQDTTDQHHEWLLSCCSNHIIWYAKVSMAGYYRPTPWVTIELLLQSYYLVCKSEYGRILQTNTMSDYWAAAPIILFGMQKWVWQDTTDQHHEWLLSCCSNHIIWYAKVSMAGYYRPTPWVTIELLLQSYDLVCKSDYGRILQTYTMSDYWAAAPIILFGMQKWVWQDTTDQHHEWLLSCCSNHMIWYAKVIMAGYYRPTPWVTIELLLQSYYLVCKSEYGRILQTNTMSDYWAAAPIIWFGMQKWVWQDTTDQHHEWLLSCCSSHMIWYAKVSMAGYYRPTPWVTIELLLQSYDLVCKSEYGRILQTYTMSDYWAAAPVIWFGMQKWVWQDTTDQHHEWLLSCCSNHMIWYAKVSMAGYYRPTPWVTIELLLQSYDLVCKSEYGRILQTNTMSDYWAAAPIIWFGMQKWVWQDTTDQHHEWLLSCCSSHMIWYAKVSMAGYYRPTPWVTIELLLQSYYLVCKSEYGRILQTNTMSDYWAAAPIIWFGMQKWVWQDTTDQHHEWLLSCCSNHIIWYAKVIMADNTTYYRSTHNKRIVHHG